MTTYKAHCLIAALVFPLFLLLVGCDSVTAVDPSQAPVAQPDAEGFEIVLQESTSGLTFEASGEIEDVGDVAGSTAPTKDPETPAWSGRLLLLGQQGSFTIEYKGHQDSDDASVLTGDFLLVAGTEAYAGLFGEGNIKVRLNTNGTMKEAFARGAIYE